MVFCGLQCSAIGKEGIRLRMITKRVTSALIGDIRRNCPVGRKCQWIGTCTSSVESATRRPVSRDRFRLERTQMYVLYHQVFIACPKKAPHLLIVSCDIGSEILAESERSPILWGREMLMCLYATYWQWIENWRSPGFESWFVHFSHLFNK